MAYHKGRGSNGKGLIRKGCHSTQVFIGSFIKDLRRTLFS